MEIILYSEQDCDECKELKKRLNKANIKFENKDLNKKGKNLMTQFPNKWEHIDLINEHNLPPWVPTVMVRDGDDTKFVCASNKTGQQGNIFIGEDSEKLFNAIVKLID
tara:strand:+ start:360 stop:683 length:324 start_codon:yes stop_codon:yes gene_type:complete